MEDSHETHLSDVSVESLDEVILAPQEDHAVAYTWEENTVNGVLVWKGALNWGGPEGWREHVFVIDAEACISIMRR